MSCFVSVETKIFFNRRKFFKFSFEDHLSSSLSCFATIIVLKQFIFKRITRTINGRINEMVVGDSSKGKEKTGARTVQNGVTLLNFFRFFLRNVQRNVSENCTTTTTAACARTCRGNKVKVLNQHLRTVAQHFPTPRGKSLRFFFSFFIVTTITNPAITNRKIKISRENDTTNLNYDDTPWREELARRKFRVIIRIAA